MFLLQQDMTIFSVDNSVKNVHDFGMITFRFPYEFEYRICDYPGGCEPPSSRQCIRWKGAIAWREQLHSAGERIYSLISRSTIAVRAGM